MRLLLVSSLLLVLASLASSPGVTDEPPKAEKPDLSTPEAAIRSFFLASNRLEMAKAAACIVDARQDASLLEWEQEVRKDPQWRFMLTLVGIRVETMGDTATANVTSGCLALGELLRMDDVLKLQRVGDAWKIVPPTKDEMMTFLQEPKREPKILTLLIATYTLPKVFIESRMAARRAACLSNVRQLCLATHMLVQDYDERFALKADTFKKSLFPYVKREEPFHCPVKADGAVAYSFNVNLQGLPLARVRRPDLTVLIYEGSKGVVGFRHGGKAVVGFADGSVKAVDQTEAKSLRWKP